MRDRQHIAHPTYLRYIDKSREYYAASGYPMPYKWVHFTDVPFTPLPKPLSECRIGLVTTAFPMSAAGADRAPKEPYAMPTSPAPERLYTQDLFWDKDATHTDDVNSFVPLAVISEFVAEGRVGSLAPRFYGVPTDYSARRTEQRDAPAIAALAAEDAVDVMLLTPL